MRRLDGRMIMVNALANG